VPFGTERYLERNGQPLIVKKQVILTGENLTDAQPGFDSQTQEPTVNLTLDAKGAHLQGRHAREHRQAHGHHPVREGQGRGRDGAGDPQRDRRRPRADLRPHDHQEANDTALLLRAGSLAAPMEIIEERTIGPSLGADNIAKGFHSVVWGFLAIAVFMCVYYMLFGVFSCWRWPQPAAAGGHAVDAAGHADPARHRRHGAGAGHGHRLQRADQRAHARGAARGVSPQAAIHAGYDRAWATILDSNVTTLIAGLALLAFGSGPVRGFAVVHCIGILTSMFSAVFFSRGLVNLWYGRRRSSSRWPSAGLAPEARARGQGGMNARRCRAARRGTKDSMEFFRIRKDIPFMKHALVFNVISFITFAAGGVLPVHPGPAPVGGVHRRHGDGGGLRAAADLEKVRARWPAWATTTCRCRTSAPPRDVMIRLPVQKGVSLGAAERASDGALKAPTARPAAPHRVRRPAGGRGAGARRLMALGWWCWAS
jgi:preprotein translocase subunit SecF